MTPFFNDWKRFCFVLREIARGKNGRPLAGVEVQKRAQAVLTECGYAWSEDVPTVPTEHFKNAVGNEIGANKKMVRKAPAPTSIMDPDSNNVSAEPRPPSQTKRRASVRGRFA